MSAQLNLALGANPKQRYGDAKVPLGLMPPVAVLYGALAFWEGAEKYGAYNWRDKAVEAETYIHAAMRHLMAWQDGEECAADSGLPHLGHVIACISILIDAFEQGNLIDNRPRRGTMARVLERFKRAPPEARQVPEPSRRNDKAWTDPPRDKVWDEAWERAKLNDRVPGGFENAVCRDDDRPQQVGPGLARGFDDAIAATVTDAAPPSTVSNAPRQPRPMRVVWGEVEGLSPTPRSL